MVWAALVCWSVLLPKIALFALVDKLAVDGVPLEARMKPTSAMNPNGPRLETVRG